MLLIIIIIISRGTNYQKGMRNYLVNGKNLEQLKLVQ